jgi:hypothetical protein
VGVLAIAAAAGVVAACAGLLGIDDRSLDTGDGGSSGAPTSGATNGSGVASGAGSGSSGTGSGTGSSAGVASGAAGTGSSAGAVSGSASGASAGSASGASAGSASGASASGASAGSASGANSGSSAGAASGSGGGHDAGPDVATSGSGGGPDAQPDIVVPNCPDPCVMATGLNHPFAMTSDTNRVYWTEFGDAQGTSNGSVKGCPLTGCGAKPIQYGIGQMNPRGIATDGQSVYWGTATYGGVNGAIWSCPATGCTSPTKVSNASVPYGVAVDANYVYWTDNDDATIHRIAKTNGTDTFLYDGGPYDDAGSTLIELQQCVVDNSSLYFTDYFAYVYRVGVAGGPIVVMAQGTHGGGWPVAIDTNSVYYGQNGHVYREPKTGVTDGGALLTDINDPDGLAVDLATNTVYWSDWGSGYAKDGTVGKIGADGANRTVLGAGLDTPEAVTVSGPYVFWISNGVLDLSMTFPPAKPSTGALTRMAK